MESNSYRTILLLAVHVIAAISIAWFIVWGFGQNQVMVGQSMQPTIEPDETVAIDRIAYHFNYPERYDVILYYNEDVIADDYEASKDNDVVPEVSIKRIIGLPGETVRIADGRVYINEVPLDDGSEFNRISLAGIADKPIKLDEDEYFVVGDNHQASEDSRYEKIGNIARYRIIGKVWLRLKPFNKFGRIE